ncbi:MAG: MazG-like family protein [Patescibacteria group bacterium]
MEFSEVARGIVNTGKKYGNKHNIRIDQDFALTKLYEEIGELAQAWLIHTKKCRPEKYVSNEKSKQLISEELADVVGVSIMIADLLGIDLEKAINEKWLSKLKR